MNVRIHALRIFGPGQVCFTAVRHLVSEMLINMLSVRSSATPLGTSLGGNLV